MGTGSCGNQFRVDLQEKIRKSFLHECTWDGFTYGIGLTPEGCCISDTSFLCMVCFIAA